MASIKKVREAQAAAAEARAGAAARGREAAELRARCCAPSGPGSASSAPISMYSHHLWSALQRLEAFCMYDQVPRPLVASKTLVCKIGILLLSRNNFADADLNYFLNTFVSFFIGKIHD